MKFLLPISVLCLTVTSHADTVRLHVNGPDGQPIAGAQVRFIQYFEHSGFRRTQLSVDLQSDTNGNVTIESKESLADIRNSVLVRVLAPGMAVTFTPLKAGDNTLQLERGKTFGGTVLDEDGKPVAGATIALNQLDVNQSDSYLSAAQSLQTHSDAEGQWHLDNVPLKGSVGFLFLAPRLKSEFVTFDVSRPAPPLYLERGATIRGRILRPDGTPAGNVRLYPVNGFQWPRTNADGTFEVDGIDSTDGFRPGSFDLRASPSTNSPLSFIIPEKRVEGLKPGEVRDIGDWKAIEGVHLRGRVVDKKTNKSIEGAEIEPWEGLGYYTTWSDKNGQFDVLISPYFSKYSIHADGFVPLITQNLLKAERGSIDTRTHPLKVARKIQGVLKTRDGQGVSDYVSVSQHNKSIAQTQTSPDGHFELDGLEEGPFVFYTQGYKLISGRELVLGKTPLNSLQMIVEAPDSKSPRTVTGRVLLQDRPVEGAKIRLHLSNGEQRTVISDKDGFYTVSDLTSRVGGAPQIDSVFYPKHGSDYDEFKVKDGAWYSDISLYGYGALRGRVIDAAGQPVAGAFVASDTASTFPVQTDENGTFELKDTPLTNLNLLACDGRGQRFTSLTVTKEGTPIVLPPQTTENDHSDPVERVLPGSRADLQLGQQFRVPSYDNIGEVLVHMRTAPNVDWGWIDILGTIAATDPANFLEHESELRARTRPQDISEFERLTMLARAASTDATTRAQVQKWLRSEELVKRDFSSPSVIQLLGIAQVAQKLDPQQGEEWLQYATQIAAQISQGESGKWGRFAAHLSPRAVEVLGEKMTLPDRLQILEGALHTYRERGDVVNALSTFDRMQKLLQQVQGTGSSSDAWQKLLDQGRAQLAYTLAPTNATAALETALPLEANTRAPILLVIARSAAEHKEETVARQALSAILGPATDLSKYGSQAAQIALHFDAALAQELFAKSLQATLSNAPSQEGSNKTLIGTLFKARNMWRNFPTVAPYAQVRATTYPGESRVLIEREWAVRLSHVLETTTTSKTTPQELLRRIQPATTMTDIDNANKMKELAVAMSAVDLQRALEMINQLPPVFPTNIHGEREERRDTKSETRSEIAIALLKR